MSSCRPVARAAGLPIVAVTLAAVLVAGCSSAPVSQVRTTAIPSTAPAPASEGPATARPVVTDPPVETATPEPAATPGIPPKPGKVTIKKVAETATRRTSRLTWTSPDGAATEFRVYGVTECLRTSPKNQGKPCVVKGMRIPKDTLKVLATVPGNQRTVDVSWKVPQIGPGPYYAILIRASNPAGDSIFTIAWSDKVCAGCTY